MAGAVTVCFFEPDYTSVGKETVPWPSDLPKNDLRRAFKLALRRYLSDQIPVTGKYRHKGHFAFSEGIPTGEGGTVPAAQWVDIALLEQENIP